MDYPWIVPVAAAAVGAFFAWFFCMIWMLNQIEKRFACKDDDDYIDANINSEEYRHILHKNAELHGEIWRLNHQLKMLQRAFDETIGAGVE